MALLEDDEQDVGSLDANSQDQTSGAQTFGYTSSRGAANPYTGQLQTLLTKYLEQTEKSATDKQVLLDKARERLMARSAGPDQAEVAFRVAAALGKPTRTGSFGESLGNLAETASGALSERRKANQELEDLNLKYQLASADTKTEGQKAQIGALSALSRATPRDRLTEIEKLQEVVDDPKAGDSAKKNAQARITYLTTRPTPAAKTNEIDQLLEKINDPSVPDDTKAVYKQRLNKLNHVPPDAKGTNEIDELLAKINDPSVSAANKAVYKQRLNKLNYIPSEAKAERDSDKPSSPAGKIAKDEGLTPGTPAYIARVKALTGEGKGMNLSATEQKELFEAEDSVNASKNVILNLSRAKELNNKAYSGFAAGARRTIARNIPGVEDSEGVTATTELETLVGQNMLDQLKATFGGAPSDAEGRVLRELQGSLSMSPKEREAVWDRAIALAARRLKTNQTKMESIRKGAYGKITPEANADGGFIGHYEDGGMVARYEDGGAKKPEEKSTLDKTLKWLESQGISPSDIAAMGRRSLPIGAALYSGELNKNEDEELKKRWKGNYADGGMVAHYEDGGEYSLANFGRAVGQGLGLGFGDEAVARVRAKMENRPYEDVVKEEREAYQKFQEKHPFAALGTELVSGAIPTIGMAMIPGAGTPGAVMGASRMGMAAKSLAQYMPKFMTGSMGRAAGAGATTGAIAGAGSETEGNRTSGALSGGATGAVLGPTVAKGAQLIGQGAVAVKNALRPSPGAVEQRATNKVLEAMSRDDLDAKGLTDKLNADINLGVKSTIMDASPSLSSLGEAVVTRAGPGRKILGQGLNDRLEGGREAAASRALKDIGKGVDYVAQEDTLMGKLRANANTLYDQAYAHGSVDDTRILKVLEDDTFKKAFKEAQAISGKEARAAELRGEDASRFKLQDIYSQDKDGNLVSVGKIPDVRTLDYIKRGIDALIDKGYRGEGMSKAEANALKDLKKAYVQVIDENVPEYAAARAKYAGDMEVLDALRLGRTDYLSPKMLPNEAKKVVDAMSDGERDALRAGVAQSLLTKIMDAPQQINAAQRIIGAPATRKRLEALFQDPNEYKVFEAAMQRESELFRNAQDIVRGSRTANKTEALRDLKASNGIFDIAGEAVDLATGSPGSVVGRVLKYLQASTTLDEKSAGEIATMLKSGTLQEMQDTLNRLEAGSAKFIKDKNTSARRLKTVSGTVGAAAPTTRMVPDEQEAPPEDEDDDAKLQRLLEKYSTKE
jgi:hypothetical protein